MLTGAYGVIGEAADRVALQSRTRDVHVEIVGERDVWVQADRDLLVHAVANLLDNAIKYSPEGSKVQVGAEHLDDAVEFYVRDQGIGIPAEDLERIFERFYRVDRARSRATGGMYRYSRPTHTMPSRPRAAAKPSGG